MFWNDSLFPPACRWQSGPFKAQWDRSWVESGKKSHIKRVYVRDCSMWEERGLPYGLLQIYDDDHHHHQYNGFPSGGAKSSPLLLPAAAVWTLARTPPPSEPHKVGKTLFDLMECMQSKDYLWKWPGWLKFQTAAAADEKGGAAACLLF